VSIETLQAVASDGRGRVLATFRGPSVRALIARLDAAHPHCWGASINAESTSDGTHWGIGKGRVVASREPRMLADGTFYAGWIVE
jgi:hypothetical protein